MRITDNIGIKRKVRTTIYRVNKEGAPLLLGNPFL